MRTFGMFSRRGDSIVNDRVFEPICQLIIAMLANKDGRKIWTGLDQEDLVKITKNVLNSISNELPTLAGEATDTVVRESVLVQIMQTVGHLVDDSPKVSINY